MPESHRTAYWTYLNERRPGISAAITADCVEQIELYRALPPGTAREAIDGTVDTLFDALQKTDAAPLLVWVEQRILVRMAQGLALTDALLLPTIFRKHLLAFSLPAVVAGVEGANDGVLFVNTLCDAATHFMGSFYSQRLGDINAALRRFQRMAESAIEGIAMADADYLLTYANPAYRTLTGHGDDIIGTPVSDILDPTTLGRMRDDILPLLEQAGSWKGEVSYRHRDGTVFPVQLSVAMLHGNDGAFEGTAMVVRDIREERAQEEERRRLQEEIIQMQQLALRELSTPLLALSDHVVVLPLVGTVDSRRAQQVIETLLDGISSYSADTAILDITGVPIVDTQVANALLRAAQAVRLLGAQIVLTGIRPEVAQTLVGLGADLSEIVSRSTLQSGIAYALSQRSRARAGEMQPNRRG